MRLTLRRLRKIISEEIRAELLSEFYTMDPMETTTSDYWIDFRERVRVIVNMVEAGTTDREAAVDLVNEMPHVPPGAGYNSFEQLVADLEESEQLAAGAVRAPMDELVKLHPGSRREHHGEWVDPYTTKAGTNVKGHKSRYTGQEADYTPEASDEADVDEAAPAEIDPESCIGPKIDEKKRRKKKKKGKKKEYHASDGSVAALRDSGDSCEKAVKAGKFDWAGKGKWAACQSAHIVATGKPTVQKGAHFAGGKGPGGGGKGSHVVEPRKKGKK
jgi:hypothetical protein